MIVPAFNPLKNYIDIGIIPAVLQQEIVNYMSDKDILDFAKAECTLLDNSTQKSEAKLSDKKRKNWEEISEVKLYEDKKFTPLLNIIKVQIQTQPGNFSWTAYLISRIELRNESQILNDLEGDLSETMTRIYHPSPYDLHINFNLHMATTNKASIAFISVVEECIEPTS